MKHLPPVRLLWLWCLLLFTAPLKGAIPPFLEIAAGDSLAFPREDLLPEFPPPVSVAAASGVRARVRNDSLFLAVAVPGHGLGWVELRNEQSSVVLPLRIHPRRSVTFTCPFPFTREISVFGSFNNWRRDDLFLELREGIPTLTLPLDPGSYEYLFHLDGRDFLDPANPDSVPNGFGGFNSLLTVPGFPQPRLYHRGIIFRGDTVFCRFSCAEAPERVIAFWDTGFLPPELLHRQKTEITLALPRSFRRGEHRLRLAAVGNNTCSNVEQLDLRDGEPLSRVDWRDEILYSLVVDRFCNGDPDNDRPVQHPELDPRANFRGGDLAGILQKVRAGYFDSLGVTALWLSPLNTAPDSARREYPEPHRWFSGYHGYWPLAPRSLDPRFGTRDQLRQLSRLLHMKGQKLLLDFVAHHTYISHPYYRDHPEWFGSLLLPDGSRNLRRWDDHRLTTWFEPFLPTLDYFSHPDAVDAMTSDALWWLNEGRLDGFRQDAVKHLPLVFWRALNRRLRTTALWDSTLHPFQIGETFGDYNLVSAYVRPGLLDAQFDFNLFYQARRAFLDPQTPLGKAGEAVVTSLRHYGDQHCMGNLADSHDQVRFLAYADGDVDIRNEGNTAELGWREQLRVDHPESYGLLRQYLAFILTIPGLPVLYYGDESGLTGAADPDNRRPMNFTLTPEERTHFREVSRLCRLRREHPALRRGDFHLLLGGRETLAYLRTYPTENLLQVFSGSEVTRALDVILPEHLRGAAIRTLYGSVVVRKTETGLHLLTAPRSFVLLALE